MSLPTYEVQAIELQIKQLCVDWLATPNPRVRVREQFMVETAAIALRADIWLPCKVLSDDREIVAWPANLWQYIRKAFGRKYRRTTIRLNEWLIFPSVELPPELKTNQLLYVKHHEVSDVP